MRDLFVDKDKLRLVYNPKESKKLEEFKHPEMMLSNKLQFHKYPEGYRNEYDSPLSSVVCKILLTNRNHDGIWLIAEDDKNKVSIPGGHVGEDALFYISCNKPYTAIYTTLVRELIEENPITRGIQLVEPIHVSSALEFVLNQYQFNLLTANFPMLYSYDDYRGEFIIFVIKEVDNPSDTIPPFQYYGFQNMIWYSRKEHFMNSKTKTDRRTLFNTTYADDIRVTESGILLLDKIFSTESIFGKINIY